MNDARMRVSQSPRSKQRLARILISLLRVAKIFRVDVIREREAEFFLTRNIVLHSLCSQQLLSRSLCSHRPLRTPCAGSDLFYPELCATGHPSTSLSNYICFYLCFFLSKAWFTLAA